MSVIKLNPSLAFDGHARSAIRLYEEALGATTENLMRFADAPPPMGNLKSPEHGERVLYALLRIGAGELMVMDAPPGVRVATDGNVQISIEVDGLEDLTRKFDALARGGTVTMALQDAFWGARFGMLTDAFGVRWMLSCALARA
jgi:PhnB protein